MTAPLADPDTVTFAVELTREAGLLALEWFGTPDLAVDRKGDGSPVTAADLAVESLMRERLAGVWPDDAVMGEEHQDTAGESGRTWVIDPIDGTKAFTRGVPLFSNLLALVDEHGPAIGVINLPALGETIWAGRGLGAFHNGEPCRVSDHHSIDGAYVCTSETGYWPRPALHALIDSGAEFRTWGDAYGYALVATGRAEAMIDPVAYQWDVAPIAVIIPEAGGRYSSFDGREGADAWTARSGVGTNGLIHDELLALFDA